MRDAEVPGIALTTFNTERDVLHASAGFADIEAKIPVTEQTVFEAASIAKTVIAVCVMQLVEAGRVALEEDVSKWLGFAIEHPRSRRAITLTHLLSHTAALIDDDSTKADGTIPLGGFLSDYFDAGNRAVFLDAGPGETMRYSNVGASLAALVVERVSGEAFRDYAKKHVFDPLKMTRSSFGSPGSAAAGYSSRGAGTFLRLGPSSHALYPVVDLYSSTADLAKLGRAILRPALLKPESVERMLRPPFDAAAPNEALGWQLRMFGTLKAVGHEGEDLGASTGLYLVRDRKIGVAVLTNGDAFHRGRARPIADLIERALVWSSQPPSP